MLLKHPAKFKTCICTVSYLHVHHTQQTWLSPHQTLGYSCEHPANTHKKKHKHTRHDYKLVQIIGFQSLKSEILSFIVLLTGNSFLLVG